MTHTAAEYKAFDEWLWNRPNINWQDIALDTDNAFERRRLIQEKLEDFFEKEENRLIREGKSENLATSIAVYSQWLEERQDNIPSNIRGPIADKWIESFDLRPEEIIEPDELEDLETHQRYYPDMTIEEQHKTLTHVLGKDFENAPKKRQREILTLKRRYEDLDLLKDVVDMPSALDKDETAEDFAQDSIFATNKGTKFVVPEEDVEKVVDWFGPSWQKQNIGNKIERLFTTQKKGKKYWSESGKPFEVKK